MCVYSTVVYFNLIIIIEEKRFRSLKRLLID
jgi:hypothetical protein